MKAVHWWWPYVSSEANMSRLEEIRTSNLKRTGLLAGSPQVRSR
jgi:hypothetical protein